MTEVRVATINVPTKVGKAKWERCWLEAAARSDIFCVNETLTLRQRNAYRALARKHGWKQTGLWATPNPIFSRKSVWARTAARRYRLHARLVWWKKWPGYNAARWATVAAYRDRKTGEHVAVIGTHLAPRGQKVESGSRTRARQKSVKVLNQILGNQRRLNRPTVVLGDVNMNPPPKLAGVKWLMAGIDQIGVTGSSRSNLARRTTGKFSAPTDHKFGHMATIRIERKR